MLRTRLGLKQPRPRYAAYWAVTLAGLVNNAGVAVVSPLLNLSIEEFRRQIDINLTGAVIAIQAFAPLLGTDPELTGAAGRIVNISSMGGKIGVPFLAAYSASKSALEVLSHSLRRELLPFGIDVIVIVPGMVATSIWSKAEQFVDTHAHTYFKTSYEPAVAAIRRYIDLGKHGLPPERLGRIVMHALITANPKTSYKITRYPFPNEIDRYLPKRLVDRVLGRILDCVEDAFSMANAKNAPIMSLNIICHWARSGKTSSAVKLGKQLSTLVFSLGLNYFHY